MLEQAMTLDGQTVTEDGVDAQRDPRLPASSRLWFGALGGAISWLAHLFISYGLATILCMPGQLLMLHGATLLAALVAAAAAWVGWRARGVLRHQDGKAEPSSSWRRARFLATFGFYSGVIFLTAILLQGAPNFFLDPCRAMG